MPQLPVQQKNAILIGNFPEGYPHGGHFSPGNRTHNKFRHLEMQYRLMCLGLWQQSGNRPEREGLKEKLRPGTLQQCPYFKVKKVPPLYRWFQVPQ